MSLYKTNVIFKQHPSDHDPNGKVSLHTKQSPQDAKDSLCLSPNYQAVIIKVVYSRTVIGDYEEICQEIQFSASSETP